MKPFSDANRQQLSRGGVGVIPTDTLYGLVGCALDERVVQRVYAIRKRDMDKPCIILIASIADIHLFGIQLSVQEQAYVHRWWPGAVSVVLPVSQNTFAYLHRGKGSLAFRCPDDQALRELLTQTGPLIAPSANVQGLPPATTIAEARAYFGTAVDLYVDSGVLSGEPSTVVQFKCEIPHVLRQGSVEIP